MSIQSRLNKLEAARNEGGECRCTGNVNIRVLLPSLEGSVTIADDEPLYKTCEFCGGCYRSRIVVTNRHEEVGI